MNDDTIVFNTLNRAEWLLRIASVHDRYDKDHDEKNVLISFGKDVNPLKMLPFHHVTLACIIQFLIDRKKHPYLSNENQNVLNHLFRELRFQEYWSGGKNHVETEFDSNIFNLWRITEQEMDSFAYHVHDYFKSLFADKDLSPIVLCLTESFYNIFDHAEANNNAFVFIKYNEDKKLLHVAVADFGKGICTSVREFSNIKMTDREALTKALEYNFTVKSTSRNRGFGLSNIIENSDTARIFSGKSLFLKTERSSRIYDIPFPFYGTLVYFEVDLSKTETEEIIDNFNF